MFTRSPVFEETYKKYLKQIAGIEFKPLEEKLGVKTENDDVIIPFFGKSYMVSGKGIIDPSGKLPPLEVSVILCNYIIRCPDVEKSLIDHKYLSGSNISTMRCRRESKHYSKHNNKPFIEY